MNTYTVVLGANSMTLDVDPVGNFPQVVIPYSNIVNVTGVHNQKPVTAQEGEWAYKYNTMTILQIDLSDGRCERIELREVSNQATWNLGTLAALNQAIADINAVL